MYSEKIESFLGFLREAQQDYNISISQENDANDETQDILHKIELGENTYHEYARLSRALRIVRYERRKAKDTKCQLQPVVDWISQNSKAIKGLEQLLGAVRKAERGTENRYYTPKTDIVEKALRGG